MMRQHLLAGCALLATSLVGAPVLAQDGTSLSGAAAITAASSNAPALVEAKPRYRNIMAFYRNIMAFEGDVTPNYRNIMAFSGERATLIRAQELALN